MKLIVIGASAAGMKAACRAKRLLQDCEVTVFDRYEHISYGACGLPYYLSGDIENIEALMKTPYGIKRDADFFVNSKGIIVKTPFEVNNIDTSNKFVNVKDLKSGETSEVSYDKLVIATGASSNKPPIPGIDSEKVDFFKSVDDAVKLKGLLEKGELGSVGIIGGGFIGLELCEAFTSLWGCDVTLFEAMDRLLPMVLDKEMSSLLESYMELEEIQLHIGCKVESINEVGAKVEIKTSTGDVFSFDRVIVCTGVTPDVEFVREAGIDIGKSRGIIVNDMMQTSVEDIFAAGDCVESINSITKEPCIVPLGSLANRQGRVVGSNIAGKADVFKPVTSACAVKVLDYTVSATGITEDRAIELGLSVDCQWGTFTDIPDYYPESKNIHFKLVFDPETRRVLGCQGVGFGDSVKRIDVITNLIRNEGTLEDLLDLEFAYAPPYSPPLDPIFSLGCAALNHLDLSISGENPQSDISKDFDLVLDVRLETEAQNRPIDHSNVLNIPLSDVRKKLNEISQDKSILVVCSKGVRSSESAGLLLKSGFEDVRYLGGGLLMRTKI